MILMTVGQKYVTRNGMPVECIDVKTTEGAKPSTLFRIRPIHQKPIKRKCLRDGNVWETVEAVAPNDQWVTLGGRWYVAWDIKYQDHLHQSAMDVVATLEGADDAPDD